VRRGRPAWVGQPRRPLLALAVAILCGAAYLAGVWHGANANTNITCDVSEPGTIVCSDTSDPAVPVQPTPTTPPASGSA
jgi:hypothetical protein